MNTQQKRNGAFTSLFYGMIAALPMGALAMIPAPLSGMQFAAPLRLIASSLLGQAALSGATGLLLGLVLHMMTGAALGAVYAYLLGPGAAKMLYGALYGLAVWLLATLSLGHVAPIMAQQMPYWLFAMAHLVYGATLALLWRR